MVSLRMASCIHKLVLRQTQSDHILVNYSGTLIIGPLLGEEKGGQISEVVTLSRLFKHSLTKTGQLKSGLFVKVVRLSRWSHFKVPLYSIAPGLY